MGYTSQRKNFEGCPHGVMVKAMDSGIVVSEFELQLRYYVYFWTNTLGLNSTTTVFLGGAPLVV